MSHYEQEPDSPFVVLAHFYPAVQRAFSQRLGMSFSRIEVLHELMHEGELSQAELARRLDKEGALLTRFLKQMEADGLVTRRVDPADNRYTLVRLAPAGETTLQRMDALGQEQERALLEGVSDADRAAVIRILLQIEANFERMTQ